MTRYRERRSYCVYILGSLSGTFYVGVTSRLDRRIFQHKQHTFAGFSSKYGADRLLYWESYDDIHKAIGREKQLKGWRREKKVALIELVNPHWGGLKQGLASLDKSQPPVVLSGASLARSAGLAESKDPYSNPKSRVDGILLESSKFQQNEKVESVTEPRQNEGGGGAMVVELRV